MEKFIELVQYVGFAFAQVFNGFLLYLLCAQADKGFGRYRILMIIFSMFAMFYSAIELLTLPVMFSKGRSLCVSSNGPLKNYKIVGVPLSSLYCGLFGGCISLLALQFYYRYIAVCKPKKLYYFDGKRIFATTSPCLVVLVIWTATVYFLTGPDLYKQIYYHDVLLEYFNADSYKVSFVSMVYQLPATEFEPSRWIYSQVLASGILSTLMTNCFLTIIYCGFQAFRQMKNCGAHMSSKTKELNRQLFLTLGMQTLLPLFTMYIPVGSLIFLPLLGIELGVNANKAGALLGLYPALDALIAIILIKDFRKFVMCKKQHEKVGTTNTNSTGNSVFA